MIYIRRHHHLWWDRDWRPVVRTEDTACRLPGNAAASQVCNSGISVGQIRSLSATAVGQHSGLHQQSGGHHPHV